MRNSHCHAHCGAHVATALSRVFIYGSTRLAVAVKHGLQSSSVSPETAASVMAGPGTMCIATVTVLVILAVAVQPGEPLPNRKNGFMSVQKNVCMQGEAACYTKICVCMSFIILFFKIYHENMLAADCCRQSGNGVCHNYFGSHPPLTFTCLVFYAAIDKSISWNM